MQSTAATAMRLAPLLALLLAAPALHAQTCTPDPTPPQSYYPLGVGDEWVYQVEPYGAEVMFVSRRVLREEAVGGVTYAVDQTCRVDGSGAQTCEPERRVRYDPVTTAVLFLRDDGQEQAAIYRLGGGLTRGPIYREECFVDLGQTARIGATDYDVPQVKAEYSIDFGPPALAAGVGETFYRDPATFATGALVYARIGGQVFGTHPTEPGPDPLPAEVYAPLAVGTRAEFRLRTQAGTTTGFRREMVVRDTLIGGVTWHVRRDQTFSADRERTAEVRRVLRFDAPAANVAEWTPAGTALLYPCRLDLDRTGPEVQTCAPGVVYTKQTRNVLPYTVATTLAFSYDFGTTQIAAGLGLVLRVDEGVFTERVYRVDGLPFLPDLTPPQDYFPLEVGNEWIYRYTENSVYGVSDTYERRRVLREETVDGQVYAVDQTCTLNTRDATPAWGCAPERRVRFDPATTDVVLSLAPGVTSVLFCRLGADFGAPLPAGCDGGAYVEAPTSVRIGGANYGVASSKRLSTLANVAPAAFLAGIGPAERPVGEFQTSTFEFARVRGVEYGQRPVAGETSAGPAEALALAVAPNPTTGALRLALTLPDAQTVRLEAFDALGRRVWQQTAALSAGAQALAVDASAWAPGVYVVRASAGQVTASARVVRQ